jgi:hypothetical protein
VFDVQKILASYRFSFNTEKELQEGIAKALTTNSLEFSREYTLSPRDRVDFLLTGGRGIEVKLDGSANQLASQVRRYMDHPDINELLVVVTKARLCDLPKSLNGKPIFVYCLRNM